MKITNDYTILIKNIITEQELDCEVIELPIIINCAELTYIGAYIFNENEDYLSIIVLNDEGREHAKIINKEYITSVEIIYEDMLNSKDKGGIKGYD